MARSTGQRGIRSCAGQPQSLASGSGLASGSNLDLAFDLLPRTSFGFGLIQGLGWLGLGFGWIWLLAFIHQDFAWIWLDFGLISAGFGLAWA